MALGKKTLLMTFVLLWLLLGCTKSPVVLDRALVKNATELKVTDVMVRHEPTNKMARVNAILPQKTLEIGFSGQPMLAKRAVIRWRDGYGQDREVKLKLPYDRIMAKHQRAVQLIYVIFPSGEASVYLHDGSNIDADH